MTNGTWGWEEGCCGGPAGKEESQEDISRFAALHEFCCMHFAGKDSVPWKEGTFLRAARVYEVQVWVDSGGKKLPMPSGHYLFLIIQISQRYENVIQNVFDYFVLLHTWPE